MRRTRSRQLLRVVSPVQREEVRTGSHREEEGAQTAEARVLGESQGSLPSVLFSKAAAGRLHGLAEGCLKELRILLISRPR